MSRQEVMKEKLQDRLQELKTLRDEIRLDLHLATMDLRNEWKDLETSLPDPALAAEQIRHLTGEALEKLSAQLLAFRNRLRRGGGSDGRVASLMNQVVIVCSPWDTVAHAVGLMWHHDVGCLPVVDDQGRVSGMITDRDAAIAATTRGRRLDEMSVSSVMAADVCSCRAEDAIQDALALMRARQVHRLPVVDESGKLLAVVSLNDAARALAGQVEKTARANGAAEIVATLNAITTPRNASADSGLN